MKKKTILSLDTATHCGFAIRRDDKIILSGAENFTSKTEGRKLSKFRKWLQSLIQRYHITEIVAEDIFYDKFKIKAFISLASMRGVMLAVAEESNLSVTFIEPTEHKRYLCHSSYATKTDTQKALQRSGYGKIENNDEADAIAILLTHIKAPIRPYRSRSR